MVTSSQDATSPTYDDNVFLNVPFDRQYRSLFRALVFAVQDCGFQARCALESSDGSVVRVDKLYDIIGDCKYGIHDISRTSLDPKSGLPRFNMPLELGVFLGAKRFGDTVHRRKNCLVLDRLKFRYQKFCSDLAGQDIRAHGNKVALAIGAVRDWLSDARRQSGAMVPGGRKIADRYDEFTRYLPGACRVYSLDANDLTFLDFRTLVIGWLDAHQW